MSQYASAELARCRKQDHRFTAAWSDKTPMKVSLICATCTDRMPGKTVYVAYGIDTQSFGPWRSSRVGTTGESNVEESSISTD